MLKARRELTISLKKNSYKLALFHDDRWSTRDDCEGEDVCSRIRPFPECGAKERALSVCQAESQ